MGFLKRLFGGGNRLPEGDRGLYYYVQPKRCPEIVQIRIDPYNDLSLTDDGKGYWVRKVASATRCPFQAEITLYFDKQRRMTGSEVENGELVDEDDYNAYIEARTAEAGDE